MNEDSKLRELLEKKIQQRMASTESLSDYSQNLLTEIESMKESYHPEQSPTKALEGEELALELRSERELQHQLQLSLDKLRLRMLEIIKE